MPDIVIYDVPQPLLDAIKANADSQGLSLEDYLRLRVERAAAEYLVEEKLRRWESRERRKRTGRRGKKS